MDLSFRAFGKETSPCIIILHGMMGSSRNWQSIATALSKDFYVLALDLRNHGDSPHSPIMNYECLIEDLLIFTNKYHIKHFSLLGHSLGGKLAMYFACLYPNNIEKLIIIDIAPKKYLSTFKKELEALSQLDLSLLHSRQEADQALASSIPDQLFRQFLLSSLARDTQMRFFWKNNVEGLLNNLDHITANPLQPEHIYNGPTLFIQGGSSSFIEKEDYSIIKKHFPNSNIQTFDHVGHNPHSENPELFLKTVLSFY